MDKYKVTLIWEMTKEVMVEAEDWMQAQDIAIEQSDTSGGQYVEDSMQAPFADWKGEV